MSPHQGDSKDEILMFQTGDKIGGTKYQSGKNYGEGVEARLSDQLKILMMCQPANFNTKTSHLLGLLKYQTV